MADALLRTNKEITEIFQRHYQTVYRVCFGYLKNTADVEDLVQDTFYQMIVSEKHYESVEHEKAWLIRTASNLCKNKLKHWWRKKEALEDYEDRQATPQQPDYGLLDLVLGLPAKYKTVVYLYYYEGYDSKEIAQILQKPQSTIRNHLSEARQVLKEVIGEEL